VSGRGCTGSGEELCDFRHGDDSLHLDLRHALSLDGRCLPEFLTEGDEFRTEQPRKPEVTRVIGGEAGRQRNFEACGVVDCDLLDCESIAQLESGEQRFAERGTLPGT
jgi:hypothetical protein